MGAEARSMKRKRSIDESAVAYVQKKVARVGAPKPATPKATTTRSISKKESPTCLLTRVLRQYGLLETITSCLFPSDLLSLALSCKAAYNAMFPRPGSVNNLLSKLRCSGSGIAIRTRRHSKSTFFYAYECTEFTQCSTTSRRPNVESRPCISCKVTTCDECRIHCVYQSIYEAPSDPEDLPNFSGFVLLDPFEVAILSPHHLPRESDDMPAWRNPATDSTAGPYHDQGFLDMPLDSDQAATPEKISDVLDIDLGVVSLRSWSASSQFGFPSPVLKSLCKTVGERKLLLCDSCYIRAPKGHKAIVPELPKLPWLSERIDENAQGLKECHCSLRSRILDRWQCLKCYENEESAMSSIASQAPKSDKCMCRCGHSAKKAVCMWCWGEIIEGRDAREHAHL
ncbi:hypothetical protein EKO04_007663 [Ascochyta lentis]|uniref:Uncharacterized protein n=1 Tax=Ascochyta lentis TaxID=205686 RepID=A0A8H7J1W1_9PLEO|nr:hypothetical protein EKO04_007663 [Ascochyta lentis]